MTGLERAAGKGRIAEQQLTQGTIAQALQVEAVVLQLRSRGDAAGEHPGLAMTAQIDFTHPALAVGRNA